MNAYYFDAEITPESITELMYRIEETREKSVIKTVEGSDDVDVLQNHIIIYFSTNGGLVASAHVLSSYIKELILKEYLSVDLVVTQWCHSAGLLMLMDLYEFRLKMDVPASLNFKFFKHSEAILHEVSIDLNTRTSQKEIDGRINKIKNRRIPVLSFFKKHLTREEIKQFNSSEDVYISSDRLCDIFKGTLIKTY